jgi:hypothetical protein
MTRSFGKSGAVDPKELFPEFRRAEEAKPEAEEAAPAPAAPKREPAILSIMARLAELLAEETRLIREGKYDAFHELQRQKGDLIRQAERLEHDPRAKAQISEIDQDDLRSRLEEFNETVEGNMRAIGAVKDALTQVRSQAIRKLEEEKGDGVYSRDGGRKSLHHLSLNGTQVKL